MRKVEDEKLLPESTADIPEGWSSFMNWVEFLTMEKADRAEAQLWLKANIVPLMRDVDNPDRSKKTKQLPIPLLETHLKLIESVAVHQHTDNIIALEQEQ